MSERERGDNTPLGVFMIGAVFGAALAYFASRKPSSAGGLHIDDWMEAHGLTGLHLLDRLKKLLHVRKNGHGLPGGNGHGAIRRHN